MTQMNLSTGKKNHGHGEQTCGCQGGGGESWYQILKRRG